VRRRRSLRRTENKTGSPPVVLWNGDETTCENKKEVQRREGQMEKKVKIGESKKNSMRRRKKRWKK